MRQKSQLVRFLKKKALTTVRPSNPQ